MTDHLALPLDPEDITAGWLSQALAQDLPGVDVSGVEVLDQHSGTTGRVRLGLTFGSGPPGPPSVFVKLPPFEEAQRTLVARTDMGRREARFYAGPAREVPMLIPHAYYAASGDEPTEYVMVLEDLVASGADFTTRTDPMVEEGGADVIEGLARLHAHFWNDSRFADELSWVTPAMRGGYAAKLIGSALEQFGTELPPVFTALCEIYMGNWERICDLWDDGEQTLIHGDTHAGNQFRRDGRMGIYDWAVISRSPGIRDVSIYLGNSCPTELRRAREQGWIGSYRDVLVAAGVAAPSFDQLWLRYRIGVLYAWVAATTTASMGSRWQPIEIGMRGMARATDACADLETVEALREAL